MQKCSTNGDRDRDRGKTTTISTVGRHTANRVVLIIGRQDWHRIVVTARRQRFSSCHHHHHHQHRRLLLCSSDERQHTQAGRRWTSPFALVILQLLLFSCVFESLQTDRQSVSEAFFLLPSLWQFSASSSRTHCHISRCWAQCQAAAVDDAADADARAILMAPLSLPSLSIFPLFSSVGAVILFGHP